MTILGMWSFDLGVTPPDFAGTDNYTLDTSLKKTGIASARFPGSCTRYKDIPASADVTIGGAFNAEPSSSATAAAVVFCADGGAVSHVAVGINPTTRIWEVRRGLVASTSMTGGTLLAAGTNPVETGAWRYLEARCTIHDSTGRIQLWIDGVLEIDFTGDTRNGGTSTNIDRVYLGALSIVSNVYTNWDDVYFLNALGSINNARFGEIDVRYALPTGNGSVNTLVGSDGNSTDNYALVDESGTPSMSDYVGSATAGLKDLYAIADAPANAADVLAVRAYARGLKADLGPATFKHLTKANGSTKTDDTNQAMSITEKGYYGVIQELDPSGADWTVANFNGAEVGVEIT